MSDVTTSYTASSLDVLADDLDRRALEESEQAKRALTQKSAAHWRGMAEGLSLAASIVRRTTIVAKRSKP